MTAERRTGPRAGTGGTAAAEAAASCHGERCITCADEGLPMRVERIDDERGLALCAGEDGERSTVEIALVEPVAPGDVLLVHAGVALVSLRAGAVASEVPA